MQETEPTPQEQTNTLTEFNREPNLQRIVPLAWKLALKDVSDPNVRILVVGASHQEMISLANNVWQHSLMRGHNTTNLQPHLVGLNNNQGQLPLTEEVRKTMKAAEFPEWMQDSYTIVYHDMTTPYGETGFDAVIINNVFPHYPFEKQKILLANASQSLQTGGFFSMESGRGLGYWGGKGAVRLRWQRDTQELRDALSAGELGFELLDADEFEQAAGKSVQDFNSRYKGEGYYRKQG